MKSRNFDKSSFFLILIFGVATALIFFLMGLTYKHLQRLSDSTKIVNHTYEVSLTLEKLYTDIKDTETQKRNYILLHDPTIKSAVSERILQINSGLEKLRLQINDNPTQIENEKILAGLIQQKYKIIEEVFKRDFKIEDPDELKKNLLAGKNVMAKISHRIEVMLSIEKQLLIKRKTAFNVTQQSTPLFIYLISLFALSLIGFSFYKTFSDVREQRRINNNLQISLNSSNLAEIVGGFGVWIYNLETGSFQFSDNQFRLLGYNPQEFEGNFDIFLKHVHPDDRDLVKDSHLNLSQHSDSTPFSVRVYRKDGSLRYFQTTGRIINQKSGEKVLLGITSDITHEIEAKLHLEDQNRILEANNQELMAFNYVASHDLQEPLRKIETFISRLQEKDGQNLSETGRNFLQKMHGSAGRMRVLIEDLLQFSRTTRAAKEFENTDLNLLMQHAKEELHEFIEEKSAVITCDPLPVVAVIPFQIQQVFTNLLNNSLKYSKAGVPAKIAVRYDLVNSKEDHKLPPTQQKYHRFVFSDNGIGFEQQYAEKIFEVFNRLHNRDEYAGTGIGLAVCKKIIENHKGYIFAESELQKGADFMFYLPVNAS